MNNWWKTTNQFKISKEIVSHRWTVREARRSTLLHSLAPQNILWKNNGGRKKNSHSDNWGFKTASTGMKVTLVYIFTVSGSIKAIIFISRQTWKRRLCVVGEDMYMSLSDVVLLYCLCVHAHARTHSRTNLRHWTSTCFKVSSILVDF